MIKCMVGCDLRNDKICCGECNIKSCDMRCNTSDMESCTLLREIIDEEFCTQKEKDDLPNGYPGIVSDIANGCPNVADTECS